MTLIFYFRTLLILLVLWGLFPLSGWAARSNRPPPAQTILAGMMLSHPRLCAGQEPSQKGLRLLRLAFGLRPAGPGGGGAPWFYRWSKPGGLLESPHLSLDPEALWGGAESNTTYRDFTPAGPEEILKTWRERLQAALPFLQGVPAGEGMGFRVLEAPAHPFLASRLIGSGLLPFRSQATATLGSSSCRDWPRGVKWQPPGKAGGRLSIGARGDSAPLDIRLFAVEKEGWRAFRNNRVSVLMLEGPEWGRIPLDFFQTRQTAAAAPGTQQIVVRLHPSLRRQLGKEGLLSLSRGVDRRGLASLAGAGFLPLQTFLHPLHLRMEGEKKGALAWDARQARRDWVTLPQLPRHLEMAVLDHPLLEKIARTLADHWRKTLTLEVTVTAYPAEHFIDRALQVDLSLEVVDLDNGSLQDLWGSALPGVSHDPLLPLSQEILSRWEDFMQAKLAYLPLLGNRHFFLAQPGTGARILSQLCPGCPVVSPKMLEGL